MANSIKLYATLTSTTPFHTQTILTFAGGGGVELAFSGGTVSYSGTACARIDIESDSGVAELALTPASGAGYKMSYVKIAGTSKPSASIAVGEPSAPYNRVVAQFAPPDVTNDQAVWAFSDSSPTLTLRVYIKRVS